MALPTHILELLRDWAVAVYRRRGCRPGTSTCRWLPTTPAKWERRSIGLGPIGAPASVIVSEEVPHGTPGELYLFSVRSTDPEGECLQMRPEIPLDRGIVRASDPDVLVIIADGHGLAGRGPGCPCGVDARQVILRIVPPVQNRSPLKADQDRIVRREAVIIVARTEEAIGAKKLSAIEQLRLRLLPAGCRSGRDWRGQQGSHANRRPDDRADIRTRGHRPILTRCRARRQRECAAAPHLQPRSASRPFRNGCPGSGGVRVHDGESTFFRPLRGLRRLLTSPTACAEYALT